jgi:4-amino-4-deoxy-L-arabinose transferase-like glycosyltransferase
MVADSRARPYALLVAASALPRLAVLLHERSQITSAFVDKSADFARTFVASGTYGFIPGHPSAYTQPLYGFFLVPLYWVFGRSWIVVGLAQIAVAATTALVVFELGRRFVSQRAGLVAALVATLEPYVIWHDVHMNREILDQLLAVALVLLTLSLAARPSLWRGAALGTVTGLAVLGNVRLLLLPLIVAGFVLVCARRAALIPAVLVVLGAAIVIAPWAIRNSVSVGCFTITTDSRALWKANNPATLGTLEHGGWIDDVPSIPGAPPTPQDAGDLYERTGRIVNTNECAQMRFYRHRALDFIRDHPGEKAKLAGVATRMLWQPSVTSTQGRPGAGTFIDTARTWFEAAYMIVLYALAVVGIFFLPRRFTALALVLLSYDTLSAMVFAGETRYRVPWDFLIALATSAAVVEFASRWSRNRAAAPT